MKRNKIRYQSREKEAKRLRLSGKIYLRYVDDEAIENAAKGDLMLYPVNDSLNSTRLGQYEETGFAGYFKADIHDGRQWCLVLTNDIFTEQENYFSKKERPIDTYNQCREILSGWAGKDLLRTYREHYAPDEDAAGTED